MKAIAMVGLCAASACYGPGSSGSDLQISASSSAPIASYRSFSFGLAEAPPPGYQFAASALEAEPRVRALVAAALEKKGYVENNTDPGLVVRFGLGIMRASSTGPDTENSVYRAEEIGFDLYDASATSEIWHASVGLQVGPHGADDRQLQRAVSAVFDGVPARRVAAVFLGAAPLAARSAVPTIIAP
jgi:hypothetical protein